MQGIAQSDLKFVPRNDPVTFEVLRHRLWQINDEQGKTIINISGSPVASEGNDFNVALADAEGEVIAVGPYIILHVSAISVIIKNAIQLLGDNVEEGDMYMVNDPWMGAGHQNDVCILQPIFWNNVRIAWSASVIHQIDLGGTFPGSWNPKAKSVFDEAPRYRYLKVVRNGKLQPEVVDTYLSNSRLPDLVELDLRAQIAAANVVRERMFDLIKRYGVERVLNAMADTLDYSQLLFRQQLLKLPDGEWYAEDHMDHDGFDEKRYTIRCRLTKRGETLSFDFQETDGQAPGFVNCTYAGAYAGVYTAVFTYLCQKIPWNAGVFRQLAVEIAEGTIHNARFPAPVGFGTVHASIGTTNAAAAVLGKMLASSSFSFEDAMANWSGAAFVYNLFGRDSKGEPFATMLLSSDLQGCGARAFADGYDVGGKLLAPRSSVANIESLESLYPILYLYRRRTKDSGGAGQYRGGVSAESAFTVYKTNQIDLTVNTIGVSHSNSPGLCGGYPGSGSSVIAMQNTNVAELWAAGELPVDLHTIQGKLEYLPAKQSLQLTEGDIFCAVPHGGGGFGDPLLREPKAVLRDIRQGLVSPEQAALLYGVLLNEEGGIDFEATLSKRKAIRQKRIERGTATKQAVKQENGTNQGSVQPFGGLALRDHMICCPDCRHDLCHESEAVKEVLRVSERPLSAAGPWIANRFGGDSPFFRLWEYACPHCGTLTAVEERIKEETAHWTDFRLY